MRTFTDSELAQIKANDIERSAALESAKANIDACARLMGRELTNGEQNYVFMLVGQMRRYARA